MSQRPMKYVHKSLLIIRFYGCDLSDQGGSKTSDLNLFLIQIACLPGRDRGYVFEKRMPDMCWIPLPCGVQLLPCFGCRLVHHALGLQMGGLRLQHTFAAPSDLSYSAAGTAVSDLPLHTHTISNMRTDTKRGTFVKACWHRELFKGQFAS